MAAITSSAVTNVRSWRVPVMGGPNHYHRIIDVVLSAQGGTAGDIPASVLGFIPGQLIFASVASAANLAKLVTLHTDNNSILTFTPNSTNSPIDQTGTFRLYVIGLEA